MSAKPRREALSGQIARTRESIDFLSSRARACSSNPIRSPETRSAYGHPRMVRVLRSVKTALASWHYPITGGIQMNITRWEPFREMEEFFRQNSPFFGRALRRNGDVDNWAPVADISETDGEYLIKAELPEVKKEDVKITLDNGVITISGERRHEKEKKDENEIRIESFYGTFSRSFSLPENVDAKGIRAETKDGVLRVRIPKTETAKAKPISIEVK
jgi:HSP20 family protein